MLLITTEYLNRKKRRLLRASKALLRGQIPLDAYIKFTEEKGSLSITQAFVQQYHTMLNLQLQQMRSSLENLIDRRMVHLDVKGEVDAHERLGTAEAQDITDRHGDTRYLNPDHTKRWARLVPSEAAVLIDRADRVRTLIDAESGYRTTVAAALNRRKDRHIINAVLGSAITGVDQTGTQILPSSQLIAIGSAPNDVLTLAKIKQASAKLDLAGVEPGAANRIWAYAPGQTSALLAITQASSSDFTRNKIYDRGSMDGVEWMGFLWVLIPDVLDPAGTVLNRMLTLASTTRTNIAMARLAVGLSVGEDIQSFIDVLPQKRHATQVRSELDMGAVRVWDLAVVSVACKEE